MRNTRAQGISMNVVILAAIAVMVLLLVGTFMSGGFKALTGKISTFVSGSTGNASASADVAGCNNACSNWCSNGAPTAVSSLGAETNTLALAVNSACFSTGTTVTQENREGKCGCKNWGN